MNGARDRPARPLSKREIEVVHLLTDGLSDEEIAARLHVSRGTKGPRGQGPSQALSPLANTPSRSPRCATPSCRCAHPRKRGSVDRHKYAFRPIAPLGQGHQSPAGQSH